MNSKRFPLVVLPMATAVPWGDIQSAVVDCVLLFW
jgi:hypothetical protein